MRLSIREMQIGRDSNCRLWRLRWIARRKCSKVIGSRHRHLTERLFVLTSHLTSYNSGLAEADCESLAITRCKSTIQRVSRCSAEERSPGGHAPGSGSCGPCPHRGGAPPAQ